MQNEDPIFHLGRLAEKAGVPDDDPDVEAIMFALADLEMRRRAEVSKNFRWSGHDER